ncbi:MAG: quinone-dependent dihydroorotate dehydrogenase [Candidatus Eisenbacteria bacterium]
MGVFYRNLLRPLLFRADPERVHRAALAALPLLPGRRPPEGARLGIRVAGVPFVHPVGLAAGYDKEGTGAGLFGRLGFGHVEVGTVTPRPQTGNPAPRLFRVPEKGAVVNRMGFNNPGAEAVARNLAARFAADGRTIRIGVNAGKQKETPLEEAAADYRAVIGRLLPFADYLVINISSPNTPGLRSLEEAEFLRPLLESAREEAERAAGAAGTNRPPLFAKLSPDLPADRLEAAADAARAARFDGVVVTNTTVDHSAVAGILDEEGGLSGRPLAARALEAVRVVRKGVAGELAIIGVGGVFSGADAYERIRAGASLVQIYTALVYEGPGLVRRMVRDLDRLLARDGFRNVEEAVGTE